MNPPLSTAPTDLPHRRSDLFVILALIAAGLAIYGQTLTYPFISLDDPGYVTENPHVSTGLSWENWRWAWTSFDRSNWHPLTWLSLQFDAQLYGLNAGGYHLTNLLLHLTDALLLYWWLRMATAAFWPSVLTALFFVIHPLHVESVAWVTERKDVLSTVFFCLTLLAYTRYVRLRSRKFYFLSLLLFALGLTAKPMLVTLPILLLLLDYWPLRRDSNWRWLALEKFPFFLLAAASCALTFAAQRATAVVPLEALPVRGRVASALLGYGFYLSKTLWPVNLGVYYPYWHTLQTWQPWAWATMLAALTAMVIRCARRLPWLFVGWCWFLGTLVPVIGVVQVGGQAAADRYAYLPHIGLFIAVFWTASAATQSWPSIRPSLTVAATVGAFVSLTLSWRQAGYWSSSAALFEHTTAVVQPTGRLYHLLGDALLEAHRPDDADRIYRLAWNGGSRDAEAINPWINLLLQRGRWTDIMILLQPLSTDPQASDYILNNLGVALANLGRYDEAEAVYQRCARLHPDFAQAHFSLGDLLLRRGDTADALGEYEAGLARRGDWLPALTRLAWSYAHSETRPLQERALLLAQRAARLSGGHDLPSLGALTAAAASLDRWDEAVAAAQAALDLARQPGAPAGAVDICRERLEGCQQQKLPLR